MANINKDKINEFISNHEDKKEFLLLCVLSSKSHKEFKHNRSIFNDFNNLNNEEQEEILKYFNIDFDLSSKCNDRIDIGIDKIITFIKEHNLHNDYEVYLDFDYKRYFDLTLKKFNNCNYDYDYGVLEKFINVYKKIINSSENKITFGQYFDLYMVTQFERDDKPISNITPPIQYVFEEVNLINSDKDIDKCFWVLEILNELSAYMINKSEHKPFEVSYFDDNLIETYEDKYYDVLLKIYYVVKFC